MDTTVASAVSLLVGPVIILVFVGSVLISAVRSQWQRGGEARGRTLLQRCPFLRAWWDGLLDPLARMLQRLGAGPDIVTLSGLGFAFLSGALYAFHQVTAAGVVLLASGLLDGLDGRLARRTASSTRRGAFLDSTMDRLGEVALFTGLGVHYLGSPIGALVTVALGLSLLVAYTRARGHSLGADFNGGLAGRAERMVLLALGSLLDAPAAWVAARAGWPEAPGFLSAMLVLLVLVAGWTTLQRTVALVRLLDAREGEARDGAGASSSQALGNGPRERHDSDRVRGEKPME